MTTIFLSVGVSSFPDPGNWGSINKIECVGSGCLGGGAAVLPLDERAPPFGEYPGFGGGGGAYAYQDNVPRPTFPVEVSIAPGNSVPPGGSPSLGNTYWLAWDGGTPNSVQAGGGGAGNIGGGGPGGYFWAPNGSGFRGGKGGDVGYEPGYDGAGGGGAAGPHGIGSDGARGGMATPGRGGAGDGNYTLPPAAGAGLNGINGTQWDASHGCGSGGNGGTLSAAGGSGGRYGGGGAGQGSDSSGPRAGDGQDGLIIVTYTPYIAPLDAVRVMIMV